jgi:hypothetical protein
LTGTDIYLEIDWRRKRERKTGSAVGTAGAEMYT